MSEPAIPINELRALLKIPPASKASTVYMRQALDVTTFEDNCRCYAPGAAVALVVVGCDSLIKIRRRVNKNDSITWTITISKEEQ